MLLCNILFPRLFGKAYGAACCVKRLRLELRIGSAPARRFQDPIEN